MARPVNWDIQEYAEKYLIQEDVKDIYANTFIL